MTRAHPATSTDLAQRPIGKAIRHGLQCRCPNCGTGPMLYRYLKVHDACPNCEEELFHHRADDGPAYLTILIVGHLMIPLLGWAFVEFRPTPLTMILIFGVSSVLLSLICLPRFKGAIIGFQWAKRMNGFGEAKFGETKEIPHRL